MDGINVIRVYRQVTVRYNIVNQSPESSRLLGVPAPLQAEENGSCKRCFNALAILILYAIGISSAIIGASNLNDCPAQPKLALCLTIFGGMYLVARLVNLVYDCRSVFNSVRPESVAGGMVFLNVLFSLAEFAVFITICYWIFDIKPTIKSEDYNKPDYCDPLLYTFTYYGAIVGCMIYGIPLFCLCCLLCVNCRNDE